MCILINLPQNLWYFQNALRAAGFDAVDRCRDCSKDALIEQLKSLAEELGRVPSWTDVEIASKERTRACACTFRRAFEDLPGNPFNNALRAAGFDVVYRNKCALK